MKRWTKASWLAGLAATGALTLGLSSLSLAQTQGERTESSFTVPAAQELLRIEVDSPGRVRVNNDFEYSIHVTNTSDSVVLHDVQIAQKTQKGFEIESAQVQKQGNQKGNQQQASDQQKEGQSDKQKQGQKGNKGKGQEGGKQKGQRKGKGQSQNKGKARSEWTISQLEPGETRTIRVKASSENEGDQQMCLMVKSYTPALCLTTTFTKPELKVALDLPEKANVCEPFEIEYYIKNTGTGAVETLTVKSDLPEGLTLEDGSKNINFEVDGLEPDEVRKFVATVMASKAGSYSTRGVVTAADGLKARSKKWSVDVRAADLAVAIDGPERVHIDREATYTVRVSNRGDAPARDASLQLQFPQTAGLVSTGQIRESDQKVASSNNQQGQSGGAETRTAAYRGKGNQQNQDANGKSEDQQSSPADEQWNLGDLKPGQTREVKVTLRPEEARKMQIEAIARHLCGGEEKSEQIETSTGTTTEVIAVPALAIAVVDEKDPVGVDSEVTYRIMLKNEGTADAEQLEINIDVPEQLKFVEGSGQTEVNAEEGSLSFATVEALSPGDEAIWEVRFQAKDTGQVRLPVRVTSKSMNQPVKAEEPTRLISN